MWAIPPEAERHPHSRYQISLQRTAGTAESKAGPGGQRDTVAGTKQAVVLYLENVLCQNQLLVKHCAHYLKTRPQGSGSKEGDGYTVSALWLLGRLDVAL